MKVWFEQHWLSRHPECRLRYHQILENPPHRLLDVTEGEYLESLDEFRASESARTMRPNAEIQDWFQTRGVRHRHLALTARPLASMPAAAEWLYRHFGGYIRTVSVVPSRLEAGLPAGDVTKGDFLKWLGKDALLVDDNELNIKSAAREGIQGIVFPQPWNQSRLSVAETLRLVEATAERQESAEAQPTPMEIYDEAV
jgi:hypothetical protein